MDAYYRKKTYRLSSLITSAINKNKRHTKIVERVTYDVYWKIVEHHRLNRNTTQLYIIQSNPFWIEVELIIE